jgi:putative ABC transport system permease protein
MIVDLAKLAINNVRRRGVRSWLTMLGIFIGIAAVVSLISLGSGLQKAITGQFASVSPDVLLVQNAETGFGPPGSTAITKLNDHDVKVISAVDGVEEVIKRYIRVVKVTYNKVSQFGYITSIPDNQEQTDIVEQIFSLELAEGRLLRADDKGKIVLGNDYTDSDDFGKAMRVGTRLTIQEKEFEVVGILKKASSFQINSVVFMPEEDLKNILHIGDEIDVLAVKVTDKDLVDEVSQKIEKNLRNDRRLKEGEEDFTVQTPLKSLESVNTILNVINIIVTGIAAISLLVGGIGITNTMYTSVLERTREIGVMKAIGARNRDILTLFVIEAGLLGLVGGLIGALLGLALAYGVSASIGSFLGGIGLTVSPSSTLIVGSISFSLVIGIISGIIPAFQASKLKPVEALRA